MSMMQQLRRVSSVVNNSFLKMFVAPCSTDDKGTSTTNADDDEQAVLCICQVVTPIIRFCQIFGIFPVSFHDSSTRYTKRTGQLFKFHANNDGWGVKNKVIGGIPATCKKRAKECHISSRWMSLPSFTNILLMIFFAGVTIWTFSHLSAILTVYFEGTDLYTFGTQTICLYTQSNLVLINAFLQRERLCEIWALLLKILRKLTQKPTFKMEQTEQKPPGTNNGSIKPTFYVPSGNAPVTSLQNFVVATALLHHLEYNVTPDGTDSNQVENCPNATTMQVEEVEEKGQTLRRRFNTLRTFSYICILTILILSISHIVAFFTLVFHACFDETADPGNNGVVFGKPPCPLNNAVLFLQKCFYGMIDFVIQGMAILFGTLCLIIYMLFRELEEQLERILRSFGEFRKPAVALRQYQVEHLRLCYEDLSRLCRLMSKCFGLAIISVLISSVISITCAVYSCALYSGAIVSNESINNARFYVIWAFHGWFGFFCLFHILIPGQLITNASEAPSRVIARHSLAHLDKETKYQLSQFQHQSRQPIILTACNIANVGLGFISAAATNVTTYILVILQFRLGVEK